MWPFKRKKKEYIDLGSIYIPWLGTISAPTLSNYAQAMQLSDAVYACITKIQAAAKRVSWYVYQKKGDHVIEIDSGPLAEFLSRPGMRMSWAQFIDTYLMHLLLAGNVYIQYIVPEFKTKLDIKFLRPDVVNPKMTPSGPVYQYRSQTFGDDAIIHIRLPNPLADDETELRGLSPISSIIKKLNITSYAEEWMFRLLENGAMPTITLTSEMPLTVEQKQALKTQLQENYMGPQNAMRPLVLEGGLKAEKVGFSPEEINFQPLQVEILRRVANVFQVPSELLGDVEYKTYSNAKEAVRALYYWAVLPHLDSLKDALNIKLVKQFDESGNIFIDYDVTEIEALQDDVDAIWQRAREGVGSGLITINEGREMLNYGQAETPAADVHLIGSNMIPLDVMGGGKEEE